MAFSFVGVFIENQDKSVSELEELFQGYAREIQTPFLGSVISFRSDIQYENIKKFVLAQSQHLPESTIAYIDYVTFGGMLDYVRGFACRNGQELEGSDRSTEDDPEAVPDQAALEEKGADILISLLEAVGARNPGFKFPPFERGFFPNT